MNISAYIEVNIITMAISGVIFFLFNQNRTPGFGLKRALVIALWLLCISDIAAIALRGQTFAGARTLIIIANLGYALMLSVLPFIWFIYATYRLRFIPNNWQKVVLSLPLIACIVFVAITPATGFLFTINDNNEYVRGPGLYISWILLWLYIVASGVAAGIAIAKEKNPAKKQEYAPLIYLIIFPVLGSLAQMFFYGLTTNQIGIAMMLILMTFKDQSDQITKDQLTGINNRNALFDYIHYLGGRVQDKEIIVAMIDVNAFKDINDMFGHDVGDLALADSAEILKESALKCKGRLFVCRYGGDEFVIVGQNCDSDICKELKDAIKVVSEKFDKYGGRPYRLTFSVGVSATKPLLSEEAFTEALQEADNAMYEDKKTYYEGLNKKTGSEK